MSPLRAHRRPDGVIELRRRRIRGRSLARDTAILAALFVLCAASVTAVVAATVSFPTALATVAAFALPSVVWCGVGACLHRAHGAAENAPPPPPPERGPERPSVA